jgi:hypothetical protein
MDLGPSISGSRRAGAESLKLARRETERPDPLEAILKSVVSFPFVRFKGGGEQKRRRGGSPCWIM